MKKKENQIQDQLPPPLNASEKTSSVKEISNLKYAPSGYSDKEAEIVGDHFQERARTNLVVSELCSIIWQHQSKLLLKNYPGVADLQLVAHAVDQLTKQCRKLKSTRHQATKHIDVKTRMMDNYLNDIQEEYKNIKQDVSTYLPVIQQYFPSTPLPPPKIVTSDHYTAAPMSPYHLKLHRLQHYGPLQSQCTSIEEGSIQLNVVNWNLTSKNPSIFIFGN